MKRRWMRHGGGEGERRGWRGGFDRPVKDMSLDQWENTVRSAQ